jgi:hypothetical protein
MGILRVLGPVGWLLDVVLGWLLGNLLPLAALAAGIWVAEVILGIPVLGMAFDAVLGFLDPLIPDVPSWLPDGWLPSWWPLALAR